MSKHSREPAISVTRALLVIIGFVLLPVFVFNRLCYYNAELAQAKEIISLKDARINQLEDTADRLLIENKELEKKLEELVKSNALLENFLGTSVWKGPIEATEEKMVVISFDDLTTSRTTKLISIANEKKAPLLLFPTGDALRKQPGVFLSALESGHTIGNHTDHHDWLGKLDGKRAAKTIADWDASATQLLDGYQTIFFRPPAMSGWTSKRQQSELEKLVNASGEIPVLWSLETYYGLYAPNGPRCRGLMPTVKDEIDYILKTAKAGDIILFHDTAADVSALPEIIDGLRAKGLRIVSIETMLGLKRPVLRKIDAPLTFEGRFLNI